ncbi:hypothetical protein NLM31_36885 [Bradyrhizobium sp. CCGUVB4N]|uniref:hypothetical protein n=1 Tax=Bradyrhizobium sp. CCGUVB4N TaxID=2949631 RepID=UPI0020B29249|nr:hypothetical protein [Bradyrhizobium sp. CCGUVB4N]MCP3385978.1 hypothetical protein [Bradyrhizobium sp. CCGUVB4N]
MRSRPSYSANGGSAGTALACLLSGAATALQFQLPALGIGVPNASLIMLPYLLALLAVGGLVGRQMAPRPWVSPIGADLRLLKLR